MHLSQSDEHRNKILREYAKLKAKWIMLPEWSDESCAISPILNEHYEKVGASGKCFLYKLKQ